MGKWHSVHTKTQENVSGTAGICDIPAQGTLINCCAKAIPCRTLTGRCADIREMTAMLEQRFKVKNIHCFLAMWRVIPNNAAKESHCKIVGVRFIIALDDVVD